MRNVKHCALLLAIATPAAAQSTMPMCYDSTRAAYYPRPARANDSLVTAPRTATTLCLKPQTVRVMVRAGATDTITKQPGETFDVPIILEPGVGALQATIGYATSRLILNDAAGNARFQFVDPWFGSINPTTREFNIVSAAGSTGPSTTAARAYFTVRPTTGRTNVTLVLVSAFDPIGRPMTSRMIVRNLVVCVVAC